MVRRIRADDLRERVAAGPQQRRGEIGLDAVDEPEPLVDQRRIKLDQAGAGADFRQRGAAGIDAADADQRKRAFGAHIGFRDHARRQPEQRPARQSALLSRARPARASVEGRASVVLADDHAVDAARARDVNDVVKFGKGQIGRDLEQHRRVAGVLPHALARLDHPGEQIVERRRLLQVAQARRVRRRDVDGEIARHRRQAPRSA